MKYKILGFKKELAYDISHLTFKRFDHDIEASHMQVQVCPTVIDHANMSPKPHVSTRLYLTDPCLNRCHANMQVKHPN